MYKLEIIQHHDLDELKLDIIIDIKSKAWDYSYTNQKKWIENNIESSDLHVLLKKEKEYVGYMNLIDSKVFINGVSCEIYGVGNVCSIEKGKGYGKHLMKLSNKYIKNSNRIGFLFCRDNFINFYEYYGWKFIERSKVFLEFNNTSINTMLYNNSLNVYELVYKGKVF